MTFKITPTGTHITVTVPVAQTPEMFCIPEELHTLIEDLQKLIDRYAPADLDIEKIEDGTPVSSFVFAQNANGFLTYTTTYHTPDLARPHIPCEGILSMGQAKGLLARLEDTLDKWDSAA